MRHRLIPLSSLLVALAACSQPAPSAAQNAALSEPARIAPLNAVTMKMSFAPIVRRAAPAVVNISSKRVVRQQADPFFQFFGGMAPREQIQGSLGSGAIVRADGVIITNNHVIEGGQEITVSLADRREFPAKVLLADARSDLAVLKIDTRGESLPVLPIAPRADAQVGDLVLAIGDPFGVGQTVTNGIVSALGRATSRPTPPSIPATPAVRLSTCPAPSSASTPSSSPGRAARAEWVSRSPRRSCAAWSKARRAARRAFGAAGWE